MRPRPRKAKTPRSYDAFRDGGAANPRKKARGPRVRLTHLEVRRGETLRLRIAVADEALASVGDELGALIKKIAPSTRTTIITAPEAVTVSEVVADPEVVTMGPEIIISRRHEGDDATYHENLRSHFTELFSSLCDTSLADALEIARVERDRRADGVN